MDRKEEEQLAKLVENEASDPAAWDADPPAVTPRRTLGAQVTVRLEPDDAERLRALAARKGVGYTSLVRRWLEERLERELGGSRRITPQVTTAGYAAAFRGAVTVELSRGTTSLRGAADE